MTTGRSFPSRSWTATGRVSVVAGDGARIWPGHGATARVTLLGEPHCTSVARGSWTRPAPRRGRAAPGGGPEPTAHAVGGRVGAVVPGPARTEEAQLLVVLVVLA